MSGVHMPVRDGLQIIRRRATSSNQGLNEALLGRADPIKMKGDIALLG